MITAADHKIPVTLGQNKGFRIFMVLFLLWALIGGLLYATMGNHALFQLVHSAHTPALDPVFYYYTYVGDFVVIGPLLLLVWLLPRTYRNVRFFSFISIHTIISFSRRSGH